MEADKHGMLEEQRRGQYTERGAERMRQEHLY